MEYSKSELHKFLSLSNKKLKKLNILSPVKIKTHGEYIINEINKN